MRKRKNVGHLTRKVLSEMKSVFLLYHEFETPELERETLIGVYSSRGAAEEAIERNRMLGGFRDWPDGFTIAETNLDEDFYKSGLSFLDHIYVSLKDTDPEEWVCVGADYLPRERYRIFQSQGDTETERWAFSPGQIVVCEKRTINGQPNCLVAVALAEEST